MMPTTLIVIGIATVGVALIFIAWRFSRYSHSDRALDLGVVSTRWLSELRRDEPWTRN
jgi:hypothetical protein